MNEQFFVTNRLYAQPMDEYDFSVLAAIATFNRHNDKIIETGKIDSRPITINMIVDTLEFNILRGRKSIDEKVKKSLKKLCENKILLVKSFVESRVKENRYEFSQFIEKEGHRKGYTSIYYDDLFKIISSIEKDSDRLKALACYLSVSQRFFRESVIERQSAFNWVKQYEKHLSFETLENIGSKYGKSRKSVLNSLMLLSELKVFKLEKVKLKSGEFKYLICRYDKKDKMSAYIKEKLKNKEYIYF